ncbi:unnamed protein product [Leptidea sinapis]|uniref:Protein hairless n=1 Tax=Leptidea sinapis TaxID=189913 RepID=A0A5E4QTE0_9NEOP|nr:unnamed protein product [Leptidea sinapis]
MHIQEGTITTLTTCTKMTEEVDRRHGVNGNSGSKGINDDAPLQNSTPAATGGRLKFFKDGKFILELVRGTAREGERSGWVSVPRKTFWPPPAPAPAPSASLSLSDDNSSLHSSPCTSHRDHCWKQPSPRRNLSKELAMYYCRPSTLHSALISGAARTKRRRPHDTTHQEPLPNGTLKKTPNGICDAKHNGVASPEAAGCKQEDVVDGPLESKTKSDGDRWTESDREKYYHMKLKKPYQYHKLRVYKKTKTPTKRMELARVIDRLREKLSSLPVLVNAKLANCRQEHMMVSPRKRILREMERVSLEDQVTKRRAKTVPALSTASYPSPAGPSHTPQRAEPARAQNGAAGRRDPPVTKNVSSYSIHSLLSMGDESPARRSPDAKGSPHSYPPSLKTESPGRARSPDLSPSPDGYRHRYGGGSRDSPTPPQRAYVSPGSPYARPAPPYRAAPAPLPLPVAVAVPRDEWPPYVYPYAYPPPHLYRVSAPAPAATAAPAHWMHYAMSPGTWPPLAHPLLTEHNILPKEEPTSDLPLNLSKH